MKRIFVLFVFLFVLVGFVLTCKKKFFPFDLPIYNIQIDSIVFINGTQVFSNDENVLLVNPDSILEFISIVNKYSFVIPSPSVKMNNGAIIIKIYSGKSESATFRYVYLDHHEPVMRFALGRTFKNKVLDDYFKKTF